MTKRTSLNRRMIGTIVVLLTGLAVVILAVTWWGQVRAGASIDRDLTQGSEALNRHQATGLTALRDRMVAAAEQALRSKLESAAIIAASLAVTPVLTEDNGALGGICEAIDSDPDVVWSFVADPGGKLLAQCLHDHDKKILGEAGLPVAAGFAALAAAVDRCPSLMVVRRDVLVDKEVKARVTVVASTTEIAKGRAAVEKLISDTTAAGSAAVNQMNETMDAGIAQANRTALAAVVAATLAGLVVASILALRLARSITRPVAAVGQVVAAVAEGDLTRRAQVTSRDEVGAMAEALNSSLDTLRGSLGTIAQGAGSVATASDELTGVSRQLTEGATATTGQAQAVAAGSQEITQTITSVAAGLEELTSSVDEISRNANQAAEVATEAVRLTGDAGQTMTRLGASSAEIAGIVKTIASIAGRTNLLALNASIEAAGAGEAGRGFAVVANEVKDLARQATAATEDIGRKVAAIADDSAAAAAVIAQVAEIVRRINDLQQSIASAVTEQASTTKELSGNVAGVARGSSDIATTIDAVAKASGQTNAAADRTQAQARELARLAQELTAAVGRFRC